MQTLLIRIESAGHLPPVASLQRLAAKDKVAKRVPAQDWSFIQDGPETYPQKSEGKWGGHLKQVVAISANGMKHLLAHVPNQELANAWLQVSPTPRPAPVPACAGAWVPVLG